MARLLDQLKGHQKIVESFLRALESEKLASSFLFVGPPGVGKGLAARAFAQALLCERGSRACGECPSCQRVISGTSEAYIEVHPENDSIKVEQSRQIIRRLSLRTSGRAQIVVIHEAQLMNPQAANALLKMIEEPPEGCYFFLLAPTTSSVLSTIRSRCQIFRFAPLSLDALRELNPDEEWRLRASRGSLERLKSLEDESLLELRSQAANILWFALYDEEHFFAGEWRKLLKDKAQLGQLIQFVVSFIRDALLVQLGGQNILNADYEELIHGLAKSPAISTLARNSVSLERAIKGNSEPQLAFDHFFLSAQSS